MNSCKENVTPTYHIILFSFNRAMQCDSVLRSIRRHVKTDDLTLSVVWRATGAHRDGYALLRRLNEPEGVRFYEQSGCAGFFRHVLPRLWMPRNLYHWLKFPYIRSADNFQPMLERIIADTPADFVSFNTDDNIYYRDELLSPAAFHLIRNDPYGTSYRVQNGSNQTNCEPTVQRNADFLQWDYYDPAMQSNWAYPFSVDGTFYERSALLDVIRRVLYHNPITLESYVVGYVRSKRLFRVGTSPLHSTMVAQPLNKVSFIVPQNTRGNVSVETLNALFLDGYLLEYEFPQTVVSREVMPERFIATRGDDRLVLPVSPECGSGCDS